MAAKHGVPSVAFSEAGSRPVLSMSKCERPKNRFAPAKRGKPHGAFRCPESARDRGKNVVSSEGRRDVAGGAGEKTVVRIQEPVFRIRHYGTRTLPRKLIPPVANCPEKSFCAAQNEANHWLHIFAPFAPLREPLCLLHSTRNAPCILTSQLCYPR
jgi:hypothetical protein